VDHVRERGHSVIGDSTELLRIVLLNFRPTAERWLEICWQCFAVAQDLTHCLLCGCEQVIIWRPTQSTTVIAYRSCLALMRVELAAPTEPKYAGSIELLMKPIFERPTH
jgi:hypothetical protein